MFIPSSLDIIISQLITPKNTYAWMTKLHNNNEKQKRTIEIEIIDKKN